MCLAKLNYYHQSFLRFCRYMTGIYRRKVNQNHERKLPMDIIIYCVRIKNHNTIKT